MFGTIDWTLSPEAFSIGLFHIRYYGLMFVLAFLSASLVFLYVIRRENKPLFLLPVTLNAMFLGSLIGARVGECLFYSWDYYSENLLEIIVPFHDGKFTGIAGLSSHGAVIGCFVALLLVAKSQKIPFSWLLARVVICCTLAAVFIRIGNLMNSEILGIPAPKSFPCGIVFRILGEDFARHPVQLYEAATYLLIFIALFIIYIRGEGANNMLIIGLFFTLVFSSRFLIEYLKEPLNNFDKIPGLTMGQYLSMPLMLAGFFMLGAVFVKSQEKL